MLIRINVGSALNPKEVKVDDSTLLKDAVGDVPSDSVLSFNGSTVSSSDLTKSLRELGVEDGAHIIYATNQKSAKEA